MMAAGETPLGHGPVGQPGAGSGGPAPWPSPTERQATGGQPDVYQPPGATAGPGNPAETAEGPGPDDGGEPVAGVAGAAGSDASLGAEFAEAQRQAESERDEYYDRLLRLQAEFDNYRKRVERQQREILDRAAAELVKQLLPVLDTADLALAHGSGEDVKQLANNLFDVLAKEGLERIAPDGERFDPEHHDAVVHEPGDEAPEGPLVSEVFRAGYRWKGRVLRPAMVKVRG